MGRFNHYRKDYGKYFYFLLNLSFLSDMNKHIKFSPEDRLAIYFIYDPDGIIDDYIISFLKELKKVADRILVVCNGKLSPHGRDKIKNVTQDILVRNNEGLDAWAFKEGFEYIGWNKLKQYEEVILCNFTIFGPVNSFNPVFEKMEENKELDFWGINLWIDKFGLSKGSSWAKANPFGYLPPHIQSHFIVYRKKFLQTPDLKKYWDNLPKINSYVDSVTLHESYFTKYFSDKGFRWDVYLKDIEEDYGPYFLLDNPTKALKNGCPFFKRRTFFHDYMEYLDLSAAEAPIELLNYLKKDINFDLTEVYDNLIRTTHLIDLVRYLNLNFVLDSEKKSICPTKLRTALVAHLYYADLLEESFHYISQMPPESDIYITVAKSLSIEKVKRLFDRLPNQVHLLNVENRGRDVSALLVAAREEIKKYDLVCFYHDKKVTQLKPYSMGRSFAYTINESMLHSTDYVKSIIFKFEEDKYLGMLSPMPPNHAAYFGLGSAWTSNFENTLGLAKKLGINVPMNKEKEPVAPLGTVFWFRPKALSDLLNLNWHYEDFPPEPNNTDGTILHAIERLYPFCAQNQGYYVGYAQPDFLASMRLNQLSFYFIEYTKSLKNAGLYVSYPGSTFGLLRTPLSIPGIKNNSLEPSYGLKEALKIYINKKNKFLFSNIAKKYPLENRNVGVREALALYLIKKINRFLR